MAKSVLEEILLCEICNGTGTKEHCEIEDYHHNTYRVWYDVCLNCKGSGRLIRTTTTETTLKPYDNPEVAKIIYEKLQE